MSEKIVAYKGFDKDLKCRGFQYEVGKEYEQGGPIKACNNGFHACESPLDVLGYYPPANSRYCRVEQSGTLSRDGSDSKVASSKIKVGAEIGIPGLIKAHVEYVKAHTNMEHTDPTAATAGDSGAATARGSVCVGENGCGLVRGNGVKVKGGLGAILVICVEQNNSHDIKEYKTLVVDGETIKPGVWYTLENGEIVEVSNGTP